MRDRLLGVETEYAFAVLGDHPAPERREETLRNLVGLATSRLPHLPGVYSSGFFLQNGARFYIDCGSHPELTTPECPSPSDVVRYIEAGERILSGLVADYTARHPREPEPAFFKANVDYSGTGATWGCHESYLHQACPDTLATQILPFLVSRLLYAGAGGFDPWSAGLVFTLSPRAFHLTAPVSPSSTCARGIFHTKDEPLCGNGHHRLHLLCGESLCSRLATWLKVGTTSLVVALIEAGVRPGDAVALRAPLDALRTFALDPTCRAAAPSASGNPLTALAIQRHYLALAQAHVNAPTMPPWAEAVCREWAAILDRLEHPPASVTTTLDWAIKQMIFGNHATRRGVPPDSWPAWTHVAQTLRTALGPTPAGKATVTVDVLLGPASPVRSTVEGLAPFLQEKGLTWDRLGPFLRLRQELLELDWRFGQLGDRGLFASLDRAGVLSHDAPGVTDIEQATTTPPSAGRAHLRGTCVRRFGHDPGRYAADWDTVLDRESGKTMDLADPFAPRDEWRDPPTPVEDSDPSPHPLRARMARATQRTPEGFRVGDRVILGRHELIGGSRNWNSDMDRYVGLEATITSTVGVDGSGSCVVHVDRDQGAYVWRSCNLQRAAAPAGTPGATP